MRRIWKRAVKRRLNKLTLMMNQTKSSRKEHSKSLFHHKKSKSIFLSYGEKKETSLTLSLENLNHQEMVNHSRLNLLENKSFSLIK